jgi:alpha-glucosidase (family GH31 glycosyl hydrolase)
MPFIWILITWKGLDVLHGTEYFPDPKEWLQKAADGFKTVVIIDPGIKIDKEYSVYKEALEKIISAS